MTMIRLDTDLTAQPQRSSAPTAPGSLGQQDFLKLLTAQMQNQDPLNPMQNSEFLGQMAQFSTVAGIDRLNDGIQSLGGGFRDMRLGMAANLVGQQVLIPASVAQPGKDGAWRGVLTLDQPVQGVDLTFSDARTGAVVHRQSLWPQGTGQVPFDWDTAPAELVQSRAALRITATALQDGITPVDVPVSVYARVLSASVGQTADDLTVQVEGFGTLHALEIENIR
jgi:flagellar basal-body rod modification protein FlgD